jgi:serine/threonine-protein phosphatase PP1 catalytic subunit
MRYRKGDLIELPKTGKAIVVTDLHGDLKNFRKIIDIWQNCEGKCHLIITGDFIHSFKNVSDESIEIIDQIQYWIKRSNYFHVLMGNHEWATVNRITVYKGDLNQSLNFELLLKKTFEDCWSEKMDEYKDFFKKLPLAVRTANKVFISHAGPIKNVNGIDDIKNITEKGYLDNENLYGLLWNRWGDYDKKDVDDFLKKMDCNAMIVGHTPVDGIKLIGNQMVVSVSSTKGKRAYVDLDLEKDIKRGRDLLKLVKYFK